MPSELVAALKPTPALAAAESVIRLALSSLVVAAVDESVVDVGAADDSAGAGEDESAGGVFALEVLDISLDGAGALALEVLEISPDEAGALGMGEAVEAEGAEAEGAEEEGAEEEGVDEGGIDDEGTDDEGGADEEGVDEGGADDEGTDSGSGAAVGLGRGLLDVVLMGADVAGAVDGFVAEAEEVAGAEDSLGGTAFMHVGALRSRTRRAPSVSSSPQALMHLRPVAFALSGAKQ